jgi:outer membrane protein TolC
VNKQTDTKSRSRARRVSIGSALIALTVAVSTPAALAASFEEFITRALALSGEQLIGAEQALRNAETSLSNARSALLPQVALTGHYDLPFDGPASAGLSLNANYVLWDGGSREARLQAETHTRERAQLELGLARERFAFDVAHLYISTHYLDEVMSVLADAVREVEVLAPSLTDAAQLDRLDIAELEAREAYLMLRNRTRALTHQLAVTRSDLFRLAGLEDDGAPLEPVKLANVPESAQLEGMLNALLERHPEVRSVQAETASSLAVQRANEAARLPEFYMTSGASLTTAGSPSFRVGIGARFSTGSLAGVQLSGDGALSTNAVSGSVNATLPAFEGLEVVLRGVAADQAASNVEAVLFNLRRDIIEAYQAHARTAEELELVETQRRRFALIQQDALRTRLPLPQEVQLRIIVANLEASHLLTLLNLKQANLSFHATAGYAPSEIAR